MISLPPGCYISALFRRRILQLAMAPTVLLGGFGLADDSTPVKKQPIPAANARDEALGIVREVYGEEIAAARTPDEKRALAQRLIQQGIESAADQASCFVLLKVALDTAQAAGDVDTAFRAIDVFDQRFDVDTLDLKARSLAEISSSVRSPADHQQLGERFQSLLDELILHDRHDTAEKLAKIAVASARKARDSRRQTKLRSLLADIETKKKEFAAVQRAYATLEADPTDAAANRAAGLYECLTKGNWDRGLAMLALCDEAKYKKPAVVELNEPADATAQVDLADQWYDLADGQQGQSRTRLLARAALWYRRAQPELTGLAKIKAEKRLEEIGDVAIADAAPNDPQPDVTEIKQPLLVHLPLDKDLRDISGNNLHGTKLGNLTVEKPGCIQFNGRASYIRLPHIPLQGRSFAICFWVRLNKDYEANSFLEQMGDRRPNHWLHIETRDARRPRMGFYVNDIDTGTSMKSGQWQHLVFQYGSGKQQVWLDGQLIGSKQARAYEGTGGDTIIGKSPRWTGKPHNDLEAGMLDFRIYGAELTEPEVAALYKSLAEKLQPK